MNTPNPNFGSSKLLNMSETVFKKELAALKKSIMPVRDIKLSLCVVEDKNRNVANNGKLTANRFFEVNYDEEFTQTVQEEEDFDTFINYLDTAYNDFVVPTMKHCGMKGDTVSLNANVDETFAFVNDEFYVNMSIPVPNKYKEHNNCNEWFSHLIAHSNHKKLAKLHANFKGVNVQVREHSIQSVTFIFKFIIGQKEQTIKHFFEESKSPIALYENTSENQIQAFWMSALMDIQSTVTKINQHSYELVYKMQEVHEEDFSTFALTLVKQKARFKL